MYIDDTKVRKPVHLDHGREAKEMTIPGMVDRYIQITDKLNAVRKERDLLRENLIKKSRAYGLKKGSLGVLCISPTTSQLLDTKAIREDMPEEWIHDHTKIVEKTNVTIQQRYPVPHSTYALPKAKQHQVIEYSNYTKLDGPDVA